MADHEEPLSDEEKVCRQFISMLDTILCRFKRITCVACSSGSMVVFIEDKARFCLHIEMKNLCF